MRKCVIALIITILTPLVGNSAPINFTPEYESSQQDGTTLKYLRFKSGDKKILLYPSTNWNVKGSAGVAYFTDKETTFAEVKFENAPSGMPATFEEKGLETYRQIALTQFPRTATELTPLKEEAGTVTLNGWQSYEITYKYVNDKLKFTHSIIFLKLDKDREIRISASARDEDYEKFRRGVHMILNSWNEPE